MNFFKSFYLILNSVCLLFIGCSENKNISDCVNGFYAKHLTKNDYRESDKSKLSSELIQLIEKAKVKEKEEAEKLKTANSTDKPLLIEGDIFTSNYEGATACEISRINETGNNAIATMSFKNSQAQPALEWNDDIHLLKEGDTWKIDNIVYGKKSSGASDLKQVLNKFLTEKSTMVGNDSDEHGCLSSAGYRWSSIKKECVRPFEMPLKLYNSDKTFLVGVLFSDDKKQSEVFTKDGVSLLEQKSNQLYTSENSKGGFALEQKNGKWTFGKANGAIEYSEQ